MPYMEYHYILANLLDKYVKSQLKNIFRFVQYAKIIENIVKTLDF